MISSQHYHANESVPFTHNIVADRNLKMSDKILNLGINFIMVNLIRLFQCPVEDLKMNLKKMRLQMTAIVAFALLHTRPVLSVYFPSVLRFVSVFQL